MLKSINQKHFEGFMLFVNDSPDGLAKDRKTAKCIIETARKDYPYAVYQIRKVRMSVVE